MPDCPHPAVAAFAILDAKLNGRDLNGVFNGFGFRNADEFWREMLAGEMPAEAFQKLLEAHFPGNEGYKRQLAGVLRRAEENGETWVSYISGFKEPLLQSREALKWLLTKHAKLIPSELKEVIGETTPLSIQEMRDIAVRTMKELETKTARPPTQKESFDEAGKLGVRKRIVNEEHKKLYPNKAPGPAPKRPNNPD
jgi:hypothetical protein